VRGLPRAAAPVRRIWGVGPVAEERLLQRGLRDDRRPRARRTRALASALRRTGAAALARLGAGPRPLRGGAVPRRRLVQRGEHLRRRRLLATGARGRADHACRVGGAAACAATGCARALSCSS
jgi:hypothetical protein